ncbi:hypothetical protein D3C84_840490 [compost metagenome]
MVANPGGNGPRVVGDRLHVEAFDQRLGPVLEQRPVIQRPAHEGQENQGGKRFGERFVEIAAALGDHFVNQLIGQLANVLLQRLDLFGREQRVEQCAVLAVFRRIDFQWRQAPAFTEQHRIGCEADAAEGLWVLQNASQVLGAPRYPGSG